MTGGSLGLRTGSYGSLQQQLHNNGGAALLPVQSPVSVRKAPKMLLLGPREKERRISWICKVVGRKKIGMSLLVIASAVFLLSFAFVINKDEDVSAGPEITLSFSDHVRNVMNSARTTRILGPPVVPIKDDKVNVAPSSRLDGLDNPETLAPVPILTPSMITMPHPCQKFSFPPPPADRKRTGPRPCPVCYVPVEQAIAYMPASPSPSPVLKNLSYVSDENFDLNESHGGSVFGGQPSLQQRNESFDIKESMIVHCGFVKGKRPGHGTGFDIDDVDLLEMEGCHGIVVASAVFGNYDVMQQPKNISEAAKIGACFYMFVDEETEAYIKNSSIFDGANRVGLWRIVVVRNLPYSDARRNGKVPKLLLHRMFPNARYSIWIDGKLELVVDPYQILERFLWRVNASFAISRHYRRFDVFEEAEANKAAGKYDNSSIDHQIEFYRSEGLTHYTRAKLPITSDVPEGCVIIREHMPITNLFTCLWFNEVDLFTSRDQLSFSIVRDKIISKVDWSINMFMDCERRNFVVQAYHRDVLEQRNSLAALVYSPPSFLSDEQPGKTVPEPVRVVVARPSRKVNLRRGKERKPGSRRRRIIRAPNGRDNSST